MTPSCITPHTTSIFCCTGSGINTCGVCRSPRIEGAQDAALVATTPEWRSC